MKVREEKMVYYRCKYANNGDIVPFNYNIATGVMGFLSIIFSIL